MVMRVNLRSKITAKAEKKLGLTLIDGSKIITESLVRSGADVYIAYPITPSNLFYKYAKERFSEFYPAPDEISTMQWMAGFSAAGRIPVSATAFPGLALMTESLNMAFMMELPLVLIVTQRLGPSTGSATTGAQGDLLFLNGMISGGYTVPVLCPSNLEDCWNLANKSVDLAVKLRTPVILLTSKEMVMTQRSFDLSKLKNIEPVRRDIVNPDLPYKSYQTSNGFAPLFVPLGDPQVQVRFNSSTHDNEGLIRKGTPESLENTRRLKRKIEQSISEFTFFEYDEQPHARKIIVSYGISCHAARDAIINSRLRGEKVSLLILKTLLPVPPQVFHILDRYDEILFVEENISGQLKELMYGKSINSKIRSINKIGNMITPDEILEEMN